MMRDDDCKIGISRSGPMPKATNNFMIALCRSLWTIVLRRSGKELAASLLLQSLLLVLRQDSDGFIETTETPMKISAVMLPENDFISSSLEKITTQILFSSLYYAVCVDVCRASLCRGGV